MRTRIARLALVGGLAVAASAPLSAPAHAWACLDDVTRVLCFAVGTSCRAFDDVTGRGEICQLG